MYRNNFPLHVSWELPSASKRHSSNSSKSVVLFGTLRATPTTITDSTNVMQDDIGIGAIQFWKVYFEFSFYTLVLPYKIKWNPLKRSYFIHTSQLQSVTRLVVFGIFSVCYVLRLVHLITLSSDNVENETSLNPVKYFNLVVFFFDSIFLVLLFLFHFGKRQNQILQVFLTIQNDGNTLSSYAYGVSHKVEEKKKRVRLWTQLVLIGCLLTIILNFCEFLSEHNWQWKEFMKHRIQESKSIFLIPALVDAIPWLFVFLNISSLLYMKLLNDFADILGTICAFFLANLVDDFYDRLEINYDALIVGHSNVIDHYRWLKNITNKINIAVNIMFGAFVAGNLPFFATSILDMISGGSLNGFVRLRYFFAACYFFPALFIAAKANNKAAKIREWIWKEENYTKIPERTLVVVLQELGFHSVGLDVFDIFTINWNSFGSIVSIILTYALLKTQFQSASSPSCTL